MQTEFMSVHEVSDALDVDVQTVRRWIKAGRLRAFRPGKDYRIAQRDLEEFLRAREVRPKARAERQRSSLEQVREMFAPLADDLNRYLDRWEEKIPDLKGTPEEVEDFLLDVQDFRGVIDRAYIDEHHAIADALGMVHRYGEMALSGVPEETITSSYNAEIQEHSVLRPALQRLYRVGHELAESIGDEEMAEQMQGMARALEAA